MEPRFESYKTKFAHFKFQNEVRFSCRTKAFSCRDLRSQQTTKNEIQHKHNKNDIVCC